MLKHLCDLLVSFGVMSSTSTGAPPQFSKRRVRVTWEAEGWEEDDQNAAQGNTEAGELASFGGADRFEDEEGYYGSVADSRSAESQQVSSFFRWFAIVEETYGASSSCSRVLRCLL